MLTEIYEELDRSYEEMVEIRRHLHQHPELSFQEWKTAAFIKEYYENLGVEVKDKVGGNGLTAVIKGSKPGKTVAFRADFDALPIQDEKSVPYKSTVPGVMHACGHDGHTALLLVFAKVMLKHQEQLSGNILLIHQHAEEYAPGGAKSMVEAGCLEGADAVFGTHLWSIAPLGTIQYRTGPIMAAADRFEIVIKGKGGHGAQPHLTKDAIVIGSQVISNLQQIVSRKVDPVEAAVVSVGTFKAENAFNVIADTAKLIGTARTFKGEVRDQAELEVERAVKAACLLYDAEYTCLYDRGYPAVVNHEKETLFLKEIAGSIPGVATVEESPLQMGGEDFAYYLQERKGSFFFTGAMPADPEAAQPHHHPKFDFDEKAMLIAAKTFASLFVNYEHAGADQTTTENAAVN
ncbi:amidohydrolase [Metabacillus sp. KIGAM252]|uniref:Amidohydrolase n=1 Tax=Metabacillus flavus TaxID=2823519 RepID=A0ABS5LCB4_9BACI|nr:M20 family metallopeptidase [Metabacillus flavus]MBS2968264.1 amidohydrolase [Metabacillus flavus]